MEIEKSKKAIYSMKDIPVVQSQEKICSESNQFNTGVNGGLFRKQKHSRKLDLFDDEDSSISIQQSRAFSNFHH